MVSGSFMLKQKKAKYDIRCVCVCGVCVWCVCVCMCVCPTCSLLHYNVNAIALILHLLSTVRVMVVRSRCGLILFSECSESLSGTMVH